MVYLSIYIYIFFKLCLKINDDYTKSLEESSHLCEDQDCGDGQCEQSAQWVKTFGGHEKRSKSFQMGTRTLHKDDTVTGR